MFETLFTIELAVLGLAVGSFLNVVIARLPRDESIVRPRSKCPKCQKPIAWYDNIPVVSWVVLRGKCRNCKAPISPRYVMVELLTGTLFMACLWRFGWTWELVMGLTFVTLLIPLIFIDAELWILPFELTIPGIVLGIILRVPLGKDAVITGVIGAVAAFLAFRVMEYVGWLFARREALGAGDKFLLALIGAFMGWRVLLGVIALSSLQGAVFGIARIIATGRAAAELPPGAAGNSLPPAGDGPKPGGAGAGAPQADTERDASTGGADAGSPASAPAGDGSAPTSAAPPAPVEATSSPGEGATSSAGAPAPEGDAPKPGGDGEDAEDAEDAEEELTFTPDFLRPGVSFGKRLLLLPWTLFLQPIPDEPELPEGEAGEGATAEPEWQPGATNLPFGPWIALAALELLLLGPWVLAHSGEGAFAGTLRMVFGT